MLNPLENFENKALQRKSSNQRFLSSLKRKTPRDLDDSFHRLHENVFNDINCLDCANCCKTTSPIFYQKDIERIAKRLKMKPGNFIEQYLYIDSDHDYVLKSSPCPFLGEDNHCVIYEERPTACREYPHTNRKNMYQVLDLTLKNTLVCPAVLKIVELLIEEKK